MSKQQKPLGPAQLAILQYIVDHHPIRVSHVAKHFSETAGKARTTILTVMEKLREKGYLTRTRRNGAYHYAPRMSKDSLMSGVVQRFVQESLGGSVSPFIAYLAESHDVSTDELTTLRKLVRDLNRNRKEDEP